MSVREGECEGESESESESEGESESESIATRCLGVWAFGSLGVWTSCIGCIGYTIASISLVIALATAGIL